MTQSVPSVVIDILASIEQLQNDSFDASRSYTDRRRSFAQLWQKILEIRQIGDQKLELTSAMLETVRVIVSSDGMLVLLHYRLRNIAEDWISVLKPWRSLGSWTITFSTL